MKIVKRALTFPKEFTKLPKPIKIISLVSLFYYFGWGIASPFLPIYFKKILGTYTGVGIVIGLLPFLTIIWTLIIGPFIDKFSKKKLISFALLLYLPLSYFLLSLKTLFHFFLFRIYHSLAATTFWTTTEASIREHSPKKKTAKSIALYDVSYTIPLILGPIIGALLIVKLGFNIFYSVSIFAFLALFPLSFLRREKKKKYKLRLGIFKEFKDFFSNKQLVKFSVFNFFIIFCLSFVNMLLPLFLLNLGASYLQIGIIYALFNLPVLSELYFSILADKKNKKSLLFIGLIFSSLFFLILFFVKRTVSLFASSFLLSISFAILRPALAGHLTSLMKKEIVGELTAVTRSLWGLSEALGPIIAGLISDFFGLRYTFLLAFFIFLILSFILQRMRFREI